MPLDIRSLETQRNDPGFTYVSNGISQGVSPTNNDEEVNQPTGPNVPTVSSNPAYDRWGQGAPLMSDYTHGIFVQPSNPILTWGGGANATKQGYASFNLDYTNTPLELIMHDGEQYLRLDWPSSLAFTLSADNGQPIVPTVWGLDWYLNPMMMTYQPMAPAMQTEGTYSCLQTPDGEPRVSNKAFFLIGKVFIQGQLDPGVQLEVATAPSFGLPYAIQTPAQVISIGLDVQGEFYGSDMGGNPLAPLGTLTMGDGTPATAETGDVRGTYAPSQIDVATSLYFKYYLQAFCPNLAMLQSAGQLTPLLTIGGQTTRTQRGVPQYWTRPPVVTGG